MSVHGARHAPPVSADSLAELLPDLVVGETGEPCWLDDGSSRFWYRVSVEGGHRFVLVEPELPRKGPAFDHDRLAAALSEARQDTLTAVTLPFRELEYRDSATAIEFEVADSTWRCGLADYRCSRWISRTSLLGSTFRVWRPSGVRAQPLARSSPVGPRS